MERIIIRGGNTLMGEVFVHGAKNSSLPLLAATILGASESILHNCPMLSDVGAACRILSYLGCKTRREQDSVCVDTSTLTNFDVPEDLMCEMRSSIVFLGAIVARLGKTRISFPGGCELGPRPIDLHLSALRQLGLIINEEHGFLNCHVEGKLKGAKIALSFPSVGATENIMLAACTAVGDTVITNAASEPEIIDLANFLNECGAQILGAGESTVMIRGVERLHGAEHKVIPDRIAAATYLCCGAAAGGEILVHHINPIHLESVLPVLEQAGCRLIIGHDSVYLKRRQPLCAVKTVRTMPYPGFPTDAQPPILALTTIANATSVFVENIFENRFKYADELVKMGANIKVEGRVAVVEGVSSLSGANVRATDLRGGAALVVAGLAASGITTVTDIEHIDRGYENLEENLRKIGADIRRATT